MKDIDFDELDRAVNSLMSGVPKAEPAKEDDVTTLALKSTIPADESEPDQVPAMPAAPSSVKPDETPHTDAQSKPVPTVVVPPAARRGRFMDVVRPAAPEVRKPAPPQTISRHGTTIEPSTGFTHPSASSIDGITPPAPQPKQPDMASNEWPDPLASVDFNKTTEAVTVKATEVQSLSVQPAAQNPNTPSDEASAPLTSPFLPDAKVEKRPLGRLSDTDDSSQAAPEPGHAPVLGVLAKSDDDTLEASAGSAGDTAIPQQPLPVELGEEVMAIEADTTMAETSPESKAAEAKTEPSRPSAAPAAARPTVTSITQQYKVQPKSDEPSTGAIYDTATYHQPLVHPAKKKPGWLWVVAIILILLLGAASGAAVYFFGLI